MSCELYNICTIRCGIDIQLIIFRSMKTVVKESLGPDNNHAGDSKRGCSYDIQFPYNSNSNSKALTSARAPNTRPLYLECRILSNLR